MINPDNLSPFVLSVIHSFVIFHYRFCNWEKEIRIIDPSRELACLQTNASVASPSVSNRIRACFFPFVSKSLVFTTAPNGPPFLPPLCLEEGGQVDHFGCWTAVSIILRSITVRSIEVWVWESRVSGAGVMFGYFKKFTSIRFPNSIATFRKWTVNSAWNPSPIWINPWSRLLRRSLILTMLEGEEIE